jgi:hypothetical protein
MCAIEERITREQKVNDDGMEFERGFTGDLKNIADMIRVCVSPAAVDLSAMARKRRALFMGNGVWGIPGWHTGCLVV